MSSQQKKLARSVETADELNSRSRMNGSKRWLGSLTAASTAIVLSFAAMNASAMAKKTYCVFDPVGASGPIFQKMKDYQVAALEWGVEFELKPYTDERVAEEDFKSGQCDAVGLTGVRGRKFNSFTGTIDSVGAIPTYDHMAVVLKTLAKNKAAPLMRSGEYEVTGIVPGGQVFLYVNDRTIDSVSEMSGKKLGILESDPAQKVMSMSIGASPVSTSISTMYSQFNNHSLDIVPGPAIVYEAMELHKGLEPGGGIVDYSVGQLTLQMIVRHQNFPDGFGQKSREYVVNSMKRSLDVLETSEEGIDQKWWINIPKANRVEYSEMLRQARLSLRDKGIYDGKMLTVLRQVRCKKEPTASECTAADKE